MSCWSTVCETSVFSVSTSGLSLVTSPRWRRAGGEGGVDGEDLADGEHQVLAVDLAEGASAEDDLIVAGLEEGRAVLAVVVGRERARDAGVGIGDQDGGVGDSGAGRSVTVPVILPTPEVWAGIGWAVVKPSSAVEATATNRFFEQRGFI